MIKFKDRNKEVYLGDYVKIDSDYTEIKPLLKESAEAVLKHKTFPRAYKNRSEINYYQDGNIAGWNMSVNLNGIKGWIITNYLIGKQRKIYNNRHKKYEKLADE